MNTNHVICRNEVFVEDVSIGQFESFNAQATSRALGATAVMLIPLYALGTGDTSGRASARIRKSLNAPDPDSTDFINKGSNTNIIKVCAQVRVEMWYDSWDASSNTMVSLDRVTAFSGFIEHIAEGYPAKLHLQDNAFILRFGEIEKGWNEDATSQDIIEDCIPIANAAFKEERERLGFTREIPELSYSLTGKNVQAETTSLSFRNWGGRSPHESIQKLMSLMLFYGGVTNDFKVYVGAGVTENDNPLHSLDTRYNVIERDIVPIDGRFVDYDVKVTGILSNGRQYSATGGYRTSKSASEKSDFEKTNGEPIRGHSSARTSEGIQRDADELLKMLKEDRNRGRIKLLLYPKLEIMDWVSYYDSVFPDLSTSYYILSYTLTANVNGYYQTVMATDKVFSV